MPFRPESRAEHHLTQSALAARLGTKQPAVARLEPGERNPSFKTLARLANTLGFEFRIAVARQGIAVYAHGPGGNEVRRVVGTVASSQVSEGGLAG